MPDAAHFDWSSLHSHSILVEYLFDPTRHSGEPWQWSVRVGRSNRIGRASSIEAAYVEAIVAYRLMTTTELKAS